MDYLTKSTITTTQLNNDHLNALNYLNYHSPPHSCSPVYNWTEYLKPPLPPLLATDENHQTQHQQFLRFPTPPITPPKSFSPLPTTTIETNQVDSPQRTQSVIMKVGQGNDTPKYIHLPSTLPSEPQQTTILTIPTTATTTPSTIKNHSVSHLLNISGSESSSSPVSDFICDWIDCGR